MTITIERAVPEDAEAIIEYLKVIGGETDNLTFGSEGLPISVEDEIRYIETRRNSTSSVMYLAKRDGKIIGNASFDGMLSQRMKHRGELGISVIKAEWGNGVGSMLMEKIIDFVKNEAHGEIISLEVRSDNTRAIKLYEKYGFRKIGHFEGFFKIDDKYVDFDLMNLYLM